MACETPWTSVLPAEGIPSPGWKRISEMSEEELRSCISEAIQLSEAMLELTNPYGDGTVSPETQFSIVGE